jgi:hypothetical protein
MASPPVKAKSQNDEMVLPTPERARRDEIDLVTSPIDGTGAGGVATVKCAKILTQTTLDRLLRRGLLAENAKDAQILHEAGGRLYRDWYVAGLQPATTVNLFGVRGGKREMTEKQLDARRRFNEAMLAVGFGLRDVLYDLCCLDMGVTAIDRGRHWQNGTTLVVARMALQRLAVTYGLVTNESRAYTARSRKP